MEIAYIILSIILLFVAVYLIMTILEADKL